MIFYFLSYIFFSQCILISTHKSYEFRPNFKLLHRFAWQIERYHWDHLA